MSLLLHLSKQHNHTEKFVYLTKSIPSLFCPPCPCLSKSPLGWLERSLLLWLNDIQPMPTSLACCFLFSTISLSSHNMTAASVTLSSAVREPCCHTRMNQSVYSPDEKLIHLCLPVWMNSLTLGVWHSNKAGRGDVRRDRGRQRERRRTGDRGRNQMKAYSAPCQLSFPLFVLYLPEFVSSLHSEGQRGGWTAVLAQVRASMPGTASYSSRHLSSQGHILTENKLPSNCQAHWQVTSLMFLYTQELVYDTRQRHRCTAIILKGRAGQIWQHINEKVSTLKKSVSCSINCHFITVWFT